MEITSYLVQDFILDQNGELVEAKYLHLLIAYYPFFNA